MENKKKIDETQIWQMLMNIFPVLILASAAGEQYDEFMKSCLYAALFGGIGGGLGSVAHQLTVNKSRIIKGISLLLVIGLSLFIAQYFLS